MEQKNDAFGFGIEDVVCMLLEALKSNGTFDEIRRHCITDIDAEPTYQNWKQRIETNIKKLLSNVKFTPELNKNTVRERIIKHLLDGCETQDIEEEADEILTQVLTPHSFSIFEPKIAVAVDEYLGIENKAPPIELNGADNIAYDKTLKGDRKDLRSDKKEKSSSPCKEPKSLKSNQSEDENDAEGSLKQKSSKHKMSIPNKSKSSSGNHKSSKKDNTYKDIVSNSKDVSKPKYIVDKSKEKSFLSKNYNSNSSSYKSNQTDTKRTKCSLEKKKKSSSFCKKPKLLNDNQSDDQSNSGGSSKQFSTIHKNKSSSSDNTKSSISKHKSSRRNNNNTDIVNKSKDKSLSMISDRTVDKSKDKYFSKNSTSSSHKSNHTDTKRLKLSPVEKNKSSTNKISDEERNPEKLQKSKWNDFRNSIHLNNEINVIMKDSTSTLSNQILHKEIENKSAKVLDDDKSLDTFKGFSQLDAIIAFQCKNYKLLKNIIKTLQVQMNYLDKIDNGFKGFTSAETNLCKHRDNVYAKLIKLKESKSSTNFIGFSEDDTAMSIGYKCVVKQLEQNNVDNRQQNVKCVENGIQNGKTFNEIAAYLYKSSNANDAKSNESYSKPINETKKDSPTVNNINHNYDNWIAEQEIKYKLIPVKVKLERLMM